MNKPAQTAGPEMLKALEFALPVLRSCIGVRVSASELADVERIIAKARGEGMGA